MTFQSADHRQLSLVAGAVSLILFAGVMYRAGHQHYQVDDLFFVVVTGAMVLASGLLARSRVTVVGAPVDDGSDSDGVGAAGEAGSGQLVVVNGLRTRRIPLSSVLGVDLVNLGDHDDVVRAPSPRRTTIVRITTTVGHLHALGMICEPALKRRSGGIEELARLATQLSTTIS